MAEKLFFVISEITFRNTCYLWYTTVTRTLRLFTDVLNFSQMQILHIIFNCKFCTWFAIVRWLNNIPSIGFEEQIACDCECDKLYDYMQYLQSNNSGQKVLWKHSWTLELTENETLMAYNKEVVHINRTINNVIK